MGLDPRIGQHFLHAGSGYGGSCFPKDVQALRKIGSDNGVEMKIISQTESVNKKQKTVAIEKLKKEFSSLRGKKIVVLGLAFKPNTDDMREASSIEVINALKKEGAEVVAVDPVANENAKKILTGIKFEISPYIAAKKADAIILMTEWNEFLEIDFEKIGKEMNSKIIVDGRNVLNREQLKSLGFSVFGVGTK